jgi:hypothetical protein
MSTILNKDGFRVCIYPNDHNPAHVHVFKAGGETRIKIGSQGEAPKWITIHSMSDKDAIKALELVAENQADLLKKWQEYHGQGDSDQSRAVERISQSKVKRRKR